MYMYFKFTFTTFSFHLPDVYNSSIHLNQQLIKPSELHHLLISAIEILVETQTLSVTNTGKTEIDASLFTVQSETEKY